MLQDCAKARREVELHWRASPCSNIVRIIDVYENLYQGRKCLLIVMEWWVPFTEQLHSFGCSELDHYSHNTKKKLKRDGMYYLFSLVDK